MKFWEREHKRPGSAYYCPSCHARVDVYLPIEPMFDAEEVCHLVPCTMRWLRSMHKYKEIVGEPVYMLDASKRRHRMYSATVVRNLRTRRLSHFARRRNRRIASYEQPAPVPQGEPQPIGQQEGTD